MKIGIIIHSKTGNTNFVAQKLKEKLTREEHIVTLEMVTAFDDKQMETEKIQLSSVPKTGKYDLLIFGAPVRAFSLSPIMSAYLSQIDIFPSTKVGIFVTQSFPFKKMGGEQAIKKFKNMCESKGGNVFETGIINWSSLKRQSQIDDLVEKMSTLG